jgi:hypothetical protein
MNLLVPKHLAQRANLIKDTTYFPIPQWLILTAIGSIEEYRIKATASPASLFYPLEIQKFISNLENHGLISELAIKQYLDRTETTIVSYRQRLETLARQCAQQQQECWGAFDREEELYWKLNAVKITASNSQSSSI